MYKKKNIVQKSKIRVSLGHPKTTQPKEEAEQEEEEEEDQDKKEAKYKTKSKSTDQQITSNDKSKYEPQMTMDDFDLVDGDPFSTDILECIGIVRKHVDSVQDEIFETEPIVPLSQQMHRSQLEQQQSKPQSTPKAKPKVSPQLKPPTQPQPNESKPVPQLPFKPIPELQSKTVVQPSAKRQTLSKTEQNIIPIEGEKQPQLKLQRHEASKPLKQTKERENLHASIIQKQSQLPPKPPQPPEPPLPPAPPPPPLPPHVPLQPLLKAEQSSQLTHKNQKQASVLSPIAEEVEVVEELEETENLSPCLSYDLQNGDSTEFVENKNIFGRPSSFSPVFMDSQVVTIRDAISQIFSVDTSSFSLGVESVPLDMFLFPPLAEASGLLPMVFGNVIVVNRSSDEDKQAVVAHGDQQFCFQSCLDSAIAELVAPEDSVNRSQLQTVLRSLFDPHAATLAFFTWCVMFIQRFGSRVAATQSVVVYVDNNAGSEDLLRCGAMRASDAGYTHLRAPFAWQYNPYNEFMMFANSQMERTILLKPLKQTTPMSHREGWVSTQRKSPIIVIGRKQRRIARWFTKNGVNVFNYNYCFERAAQKLLSNFSPNKHFTQHNLYFGYDVVVQLARFIRRRFFEYQTPRHTITFPQKSTFMNFEKKTESQTSFLYTHWSRWDENLSLKHRICEQTVIVGADYILDAEHIMRLQQQHGAIVIAYKQTLVDRSIIVNHTVQDLDNLKKFLS